MCEHQFIHQGLCGVKVLKVEVVAVFQIYANVTQVFHYGEYGSLTGENKMPTLVAQMDTQGESAGFLPCA